MHGDRGPDRGGGVDVDPPAGLTWSVRPCTRRPVLAALVGVFVLVLSFAVQLLSGSPWWGGLAFVLLALSVAPYYLATTYEVTGTGAAAQGVFGTHRRSWCDVRAVFPDEDGVLLSPFAKPTRLAYTRGLFLRFSGNRDEVLKRVEASMGQAAGDPGPAAPDERADG